MRIRVSVAEEVDVRVVDGIVSMTEEKVVLVEVSGPGHCGCPYSPQEAPTDDPEDGILERVAVGTVAMNVAVDAMEVVVVHISYPPSTQGTVMTDVI